jgi:hypothetical protein
MRTLAVASSFGSNEALTVVVVPDCVTASVGDEYAATAAGTAISAASAARPTPMVPMRLFICPPGSTVASLSELVVAAHPLATRRPLAFTHCLLS